MECREFEDNLWRYFNNLDLESCRERLCRGNWSEFIATDDYHRDLLEHISTCDDCTTSLWWYLEIKDSVDYREYPCLHLAYFSGDIEDRCLDYMHGLFSIILNREIRTGIVIGFCPWCGLRLNTSGAG